MCIQSACEFFSTCDLFAGRTQRGRRVHTQGSCGKLSGYQVGLLLSSQSNELIQFCSFHMTSYIYLLLSFDLIPCCWFVDFRGGYSKPKITDVLWLKIVLLWVLLFLTHLLISVSYCCWNWIATDRLLHYIFQSIHNCVLHCLVTALALEIHHQKRRVWRWRKGISYKEENGIKFYTVGCYGACTEKWVFLTRLVDWI